MTSTQAIFEKVQKVKKTINTATTAEKDHALEEMAKQLWLSRTDILAANELDMTAAKGKISDVMLDRLYLDEERIATMAGVASLEENAFRGTVMDAVQAAYKRTQELGKKS